MKIYICVLLNFIFSLSCYSVDYRTVPLAKSIEMKSGFTFSLTNNVKILFSPKNKSQKSNVDFLNRFIFEKTGFNLKVVSKARKNDCIELVIDSTINNPEGYRIDIDTKRVIISAKTNAGIFYGIQTFCKSIPDAKNIQLPPAVITDEPRFKYRGAHLDVSRHFFNVDFIKRYIDILALHNINTFHWHLTDDQGWRIEIKKYPKLTSIGSVRSQTVVGFRNSGVYDGLQHGGFYTQEQIKDVVQYASERYITIIPEIDMPGHSLSILASYPQFGCTGGPYKVAETWGIFDDVLCAGNDKVFDFIEDVLNEVILLFPSRYIHIGGDECLKTRWRDCERCKSRIRSEGLVSDSLHSSEAKLQSYFLGRIERFLNSKNRFIIGWDEILEGGLTPNATVMSWQGIQGGISAARQQHDVIMASNNNLYLNYYQSPDFGNEPFAIGGLITVENVYSFEPIPAELNENDMKFVIGAQSCLWTEYIATTKLAEYMLLPRLAALSEVQWTMPEQKNYSDFLLRLPQLAETYKKRGYNFAKHVLNDSIK